MSAPAVPSFGAALACALPLLPISSWFGFVPPPPPFIAYLVGATLAYLAAVEAAKTLFYRIARFRPAPAAVLQGNAV